MSITFKENEARIRVAQVKFAHHVGRNLVLHNTLHKFLDSRTRDRAACVYLRHIVAYA